MTVPALTPRDVAKMPGPTRFVSNVASDLKAGKTVILVFPEVAILSGLADVVVDAVSDESAGTTFCDAKADEPFPNRVLNTYGADSEQKRTFDEWESIIRWQPWHGQWMIVSAWEHADVMEIVDRWPAQVHSAGLNAEDRPVLVLPVRSSDIDRSVLEGLDRSYVAVHWWWGVFDHIDTETRVAAVAGRQFNPVDAAVITDVAAWDLACVDYLVEAWDRTSQGLASAVEAYQRSFAEPETEIAPPSDRRLADAPTIDQENAWNSGLLDLWGFTINPSPRTLDAPSVQQRLWIAHNRTLIVYVEEERAHYEKIVLSKAPHQAMAHLERREDEVVEIGSLAYLVTRGWVDVDRADRERICTFRDLRNNLAHRAPVNDALRARVMALLGFRT